MSKKPDFTFAEVGLSKGDILKPHFKKGMPVEWHEAVSKTCPIS